jgi:DNA polymerase-3 subunit epsilon
MGLFDKLLSVFSSKPTPGVTTPERVPERPQPTRPSPAVSQPVPEMAFTVTITGPAGYEYPVSEDAVASGLARHAHVLDRELTPLKPADRWWDEATHKRRLREGSDKALAWATPFVVPEVATHERCRGFREYGPLGASGVAKEIRALIREKRKAKEPHEQLLRALYGVAVCADLVDSLEFEGVQPHAMVQHVDVNELRAIQLDYAKMGHQHVRALGKTDVKWLVEAFGEPAEHRAFDEMWPGIRQNAVARFCWSDLGITAQGASPARRLQLMRENLELRVRTNLKYRGEPGSGPPPGMPAPAARQPWIEVLPVSQATTQVPFVVADLETTGLSPDSCEILELAAVLVEPGGSVVREFAMLVKVQQPVPAEITRLTGITQAEVDAAGRPLEHAYPAFTDFVGGHPVFFHNAPFDLGFISRAAARTGAKFENPVHDTLPLAREAWPTLPDHKLSTLARHVGHAEPQHRALGDAKAALAVLLAARKVMQAAG